MFDRLWFLMIGSVFLCTTVAPIKAHSSSSSLAAAVVSVRALYQRQQWSQVVTQAQDAIQSPGAAQFVPQYAQLCVYLGAALFQQGYRSLAYSAFERALSSYTQISLPPGASPGMEQLFASARKQKQTSLPATSIRTASNSAAVSATIQTAPQRVHVGWIVGWVSVAVSAAALGLGLAAGGNAYTNAQESTNLAKEARRKGYSQLSTDPVITRIHGNAAMYGTVANVSYAIAGVMALGATGFFLWAALSKPRVPPKTAQLHAIPTSPQTQSHTTLYSSY